MMKTFAGRRSAISHFHFVMIGSAEQIMPAME